MTELNESEAARYHDLSARASRGEISRDEVLEWGRLADRWKLTVERVRQEHVAASQSKIAAEQAERRRLAAEADVERLAQRDARRAQKAAEREAEN